MPRAPSQRNCREGLAPPRQKRGSVSETEVANLENERAKVEGWRLHILIEAGYPLPLAEKLAASEVDLHRAVALVKSGCTHKTAAEILL
jgi:hypothetical protein